jgi:energy-coupling factor transporter ATP-binding protein EcfA2
MHVRTRGCETGRALGEVCGRRRQAPHVMPAAGWRVGRSARARSRGVRVAPRSSNGNQESLADVMSSIFSGLEALAMQQRPERAGPSGAHVAVSNLTYHPPSSDVPLLEDVSLRMEPNSVGLIYGCSGGGKSSLLHVLAGLSEATSGSVSFSGPGGPALDSTSRMKEAGIVFQFPERHFVGRTLQEELTIGWPVQGPDAVLKQQMLTARTYQVLEAVGLRQIGMETPLATLSGGYKRRVALAVQLIRQPRLLLLDEPLAGLDWKARHELVGVLDKVRAECTVLVVSHDLGEVQRLVRDSWRMKKGGRLE